jgi:hypothetical protein
MYCAKCGQLQEENPFRKVSFRSECSKCSASLHSCVNCRYYQVGLANDCKVLGTETILDREVWNFCEEFAPSHLKPSEIKKTDGKKKFDDLFK